MKTAIAILVKTPGYSPLKTRLAADIGEHNAHHFYRLSLNAIQSTIQKTSLYPHWAVGEKQALNEQIWQAFPTLHTGEGDLGDRQYHIYETLLKTHDAVILIGADAPQISTEMLENAKTALTQNDFTIGPANDGGYTLFGGRKSIALESWKSVSWSVETTREELIKTLPSKPFQLPTHTDVDTKSDLTTIIHEMPNGMNTEQKTLIDWINTL